MKLLKQILVLIILFSYICVFSQSNFQERFPDQNKFISVECSLTDIPSELTICENTQAEIQLKPTDGDLLWYDDDYSPMYLIENSDLYHTNVMNSSQTIYVQKVCPYRPDQLKNLETSWRGDNGKEGVMFSVFMKSEALLQSIDIHMAHDYTMCRVYMIEGSYDMQMNSPASWTLIYEEMVQGKGKGKVVNLDIPDVQMNNSMTYGFYVTLETDDLLYYSTGSAVFEDDFMVLGNCRGISWPFGPACGNREFNGRLNYAVGERQRSIKYPVEIEVIPKPEAPIVYFDGTTFECWNDAEYVWYNNEKPIDDESSPVLTPYESGMYSAAYYTGQCLSEESNRYYYQESDLIIDINNISVYPNPVGDLLNIDLASAEILNADLKITDASGVVKKNISLVGTYCQQLNVADLLPGNYYLVVTTDSHTRTIPILKQ